MKLGDALLPSLGSAGFACLTVLAEHPPPEIGAQSVEIAPVRPGLANG
jgi:hypothetical protein